MCVYLPCSFVKEFGALRRKAEHSGSTLEVQMLTNLLHTLKNLVSLLRERTHDALMSEILGIKLWSTAPVRVTHADKHSC